MPAPARLRTFRVKDDLPQDARVWQFGPGARNHPRGDFYLGGAYSGISYFRSIHALKETWKDGVEEVMPDPDLELDEGI